jgi:hypothetical protein
VAVLQYPSSVTWLRFDTPQQEQLCKMVLLINVDSNTHPSLAEYQSSCYNPQSHFSVLQMKLRATAVFGMGTATEYITYFIKCLCHEKLLNV